MNCFVLFFIFKENTALCEAETDCFEAGVNVLFAFFSCFTYQCYNSGSILNIILKRKLNVKSLLSLLGKLQCVLYHL